MKKVSAQTDADDELGLGAFARRAAHDLANPFNAISMNAELAKMLLQRGQPEKLREILEHLIADCARCGRMIQGMQRFGAGLDPHPHETLAVQSLIDGAIDSAAQDRPQAPRARCIGDVDACIAVDRAAFERAIAGLLHNAIEAGSDAIEIRLRRDGCAVVVELRDNGGGIPAGLRERAPEAFFTTRRSEGHSGLGLTLARELARTHGGSLTIADHAGGGTRIELRLPEVPAEV